MRAASLVLTAALLVAGCTAAGGDETPPRDPAADSSPAGPTTPAPDPLVYVAVGASETAGLGADDPATQSWPSVLRATTLPTARLVNLGVPGETVRGALTSEVPAAVAADPDVVTVWLAVNDLLTQTPAPAYERNLTRLVHRLRRGGRTEVLVGNVPRLWRLPAYRACLSGDPRPCELPYVPPESLVRATVAEFNAAIARVARAEGAYLVDLSVRRTPARLVSADGFHPSVAGHRRVAAAFAEVMRGAPICEQSGGDLSCGHDS